MYPFVLSSSAPMTDLIRTDAIEGIDALIRNAEESLVKIENYFHNNRLLLNTRKARIHINYRIIVPSKSIKKLGVHFDNHMLFTSHMDAIHKKNHNTGKLINRIKDFRNKNTNTINYDIVSEASLTIHNYSV